MFHGGKILNLSSTKPIFKPPIFNQERASDRLDIPGSPCSGVETGARKPLRVRKHTLMKGFLSRRGRQDELLAAILDMF